VLLRVRRNLFVIEFRGESVLEHGDKGFSLSEKNPGEVRVEVGDFRFGFIQLRHEVVVEPPAPLALALPFHKVVGRVFIVREGNIFGSALAVRGGYMIPDGLIYGAVVVN
jgi:hypothetical protein